MTKPKVTNGNCLNPIGRLEKRFDEYKRCHESASTNCNKIQESHNKNNDALKVLLERKSKLSDSKSKKKRSTVTTAINRKKPKLNDESLHVVNKYFDNTVEVTPNVTLNVHTSEIPDIDWDNLDILNNANFSLPINENELDGVLNNCYSQPMQSSVDTSNIPQKPTTNVCKTSPNIKIDDLFTQNTVNNYKTEDPIFPPLFPPPEQNSVSIFPPESMKYEYISPSNNNNYIRQSAVVAATCNYNSTASNVLLSAGNQAAFNPHSGMYSMNLPPGTTVGNSSLSYQYHNNLVPDQIAVAAPVVNNNNQYFYPHHHNQYPVTNYVPSAVSALKEQQTILGNGVSDNYQLPAMSTGWYNNDITHNVRSNNSKQSIVPHQQQVFANNTVSIGGGNGNYRSNYPQYQVTPNQATAVANNHIQYQQMFTAQNQSSYDHHSSHVAISNYAMMPSEQQTQQYYYVDYPTSGVVRGDNVTIPSNMPHNNNNNNNRNIIDPNDSRFLLSHQTNPILCRNLYQ